MCTRDKARGMALRDTNRWPWSSRRAPTGGMGCTQTVCTAGEQWEGHQNWVSGCDGSLCLSTFYFVKVCLILQCSCEKKSTKMSEPPFLTSHLSFFPGPFHYYVPTLATEQAARSRCSVAVADGWGQRAFHVPSIHVHCFLQPFLKCGPGNT